MTDTSPEIERMVREMIMARSPEERYVMGAQMFDAAAMMIHASLPDHLSAAERKRRFFERVYGIPAPWPDRVVTADSPALHTSPL